MYREVLAVGDIGLRPVHYDMSMQADTGNHLIRRVDISTGTVTTLAGFDGILGSANGLGTLSSFYQPQAVDMDAAGTVALVVSMKGTNVLRWLLGLVWRGVADFFFI